MRALLKKNGPTETEPKGIDPIIWRKFVENEMDQRKKDLNEQNQKNRKASVFSHCLGGRSYAQKEYLMLQENPSKPICRAEKWLAAHEHKDGTVLESAKDKYEQVKAAANKRKSRSCTGEECTETWEDIDSDEIAEVFGNEKK
ncbi:PREDICTED: uncharacterized protein LOC105951580 [Erythranthe guttata]|uniref:uncharacterized protein LOC105951580 n=1 Tax=Erythranthe guttata TaxID=4155 RepID=UPI00064D81DA|nr:PREDICTED: uncharacterized protein LOC105951580 [Erythranthe guttata]|eukprot:XP_012830490.1 PREDICTED: uncharacterized protein LOC105951580 [Erythranthe guttata]